MKQLARLGVVAVVLALIGTYNSCGLINNSSGAKKNKNTAPVYDGTNTGNPKPTDGCKRILDATCSVLVTSHSDLNMDVCRSGLSITSLINNLGVPEKILNPYYSLCESEEAGAVQADEAALQMCLRAIQNLNPDSTVVKAAYNKDNFDAFAGVKDMIPSASDQCGLVFKGNTFKDPGIGEAPPGTVLVDFDNPEVGEPSTANLLGGLYQGIEFTPGVWGWSLPFDASTSNFAINSASTTDDTGFNFSGGPKKLISLKAFASKGEVELRIYDDQGQSVTQKIPADRKMHLVKTNFTKPSNSIYFHRVTAQPDPYRNAGVGLDDIIYEMPSVAPVIAQIQSRYALFDRSNSHASASFSSPNGAGNLIVAQVAWVGAARLQSVQDSAGNSYQAAGPVATSGAGSHQQLWFAKNIKAATNKVTATFSNSNRQQELYVNEYSGVDPNNPVDVYVATAGSGATARSGSIITIAPHVLLYVGVLSDYGRPMYTSEYTVRPFFGFASVADRLMTQSGTYQMNAGLPISTTWVVQVLGLKAK